MMHYLDYNATAPLRPAVAEVMRELQGLPLNPSSIHGSGRKAKALLENARRVLAECLGAFANEILFTATGTEANNTALHAFAELPLFVSAIEHTSVLKTAKRAANAVFLPVTRDGIVDISALEARLPKEPDFLVSVMLANNETGIIQPVKDIAALVRARGGLLHCDAIQAFGKISVDFTDLGCDMLSVSAHKMGGPVGAAALVVRNNLAIKPLLTGGGQEFGRRAGTENVSAIAGFAKAAELIDVGQMQRLRGWLDAAEAALLANLAVKPVIFGKSMSRLPNTSCMAFAGKASETMLIRMDLAGIALSAGSACSSGRIEPSHVLRAMGVEEGLIHGALRISGGWGTTEADIAAVAAALAAIF